jgi:hypothetical protein
MKPLPSGGTIRPAAADLWAPIVAFAHSRFWPRAFFGRRTIAEVEALVEPVALSARRACRGSNGALLTSRGRPLIAEGYAFDFRNQRYFNLVTM